MPRVRCRQMGLPGSSSLVLADPAGHQLEEVARIRSSAPSGRSMTSAADPDVRVVHAQAGDHLEDAQDLLALAEAVQHHRDRAQLEAGGGQPHQVAGDAVQLA